MSCPTPWTVLQPAASNTPAASASNNLFISISLFGSAPHFPSVIRSLLFSARRAAHLTHRCSDTEVVLDRAYALDRTRKHCRVQAPRPGRDGPCQPHYAVLHLYADVLEFSFFKGLLHVSLDVLVARFFRRSPCGHPRRRPFSPPENARYRRASRPPPAFPR